MHGRKTYADDELFRIDEFVVEDGVKDRRTEFSCRAGKGYHTDYEFVN